MKKIELNKMGLTQLDAAESGTIQGGTWWIPLSGLIMSFISNFGDVREGFSDGIHGRKPRH